MSRILVTGASGFIGSHLARELLARGHEVHGLVRTTSDLAPLRGLDVVLHIGDLREPSSLAAPVRDVEYIYHCAAALLVTSQETFNAINRDGTINLLNAARTHAAGTLKRFLFVSSQAAAGPATDTTPLKESDPEKPISWYGRSKFEAERAVLEFSRNMPATIVRPCSVYGERERDVSQVFPMVERRIHPILGIMKKYVVMIHVEDLVRGIIGAAESAVTPGKIYFLNHPKILTTAEVTRTMAAAIDRPFGLPLPTPTFIFKLAAPVAELAYEITRDRPSTTRDKAVEISQRFWLADPSRAREDFGWTAKLDLLEGMRRTMKYYQGEQQELHTMSRDKPFVLWLKFIATGMLIGTIIETLSYLNRFYAFTPWWLVFVIALGGFGVLLGTLALLLRRKSDLVQFIIPTLFVGAVEAINVAWLNAWVFAPGWPFGINDPWVRSAALGIPGGLVVLIINAVQRRIYQKRMRLS